MYLPEETRLSMSSALLLPEHVQDIVEEKRRGTRAGRRRWRRGILVKRRQRECTMCVFCWVCVREEAGLCWFQEDGVSDACGGA